MEIYIDTTRAMGSDGRAVHYYATPHWTIDEKDTIGPDTMRLICDRLQTTLNECFSKGVIMQGPAPRVKDGLKVVYDSNRNETTI